MLLVLRVFNFDFSFLSHSMFKGREVAYKYEENIVQKKYTMDFEGPLTHSHTYTYTRKIKYKRAKYDHENINLVPHAPGPLV